jgi:DNA-binding transcriptional regulator YdaS (Cro superfamily)
MAPLHPLALYLAKHPHVTQADLADSAGISRGFMSQIIACKRGVSPAVARALEAATKGKVKAAAIVMTEPPARGRAA